MDNDDSNYIDEIIDTLNKEEYKKMTLKDVINLHYDKMINEVIENITNELKKNYEETIQVKNELQNIIITNNE